MKISTIGYLIRQGFANIFRNRWYSLASVATISACLFLFGLFYSVVANFQSIVMKAEEGVSVTVFFHNEYDKCEEHAENQMTTQDQAKELQSRIEARQEVSEVIFITEDEAWEQFAKEYYGENYAEGFLDNPLMGEYSYEIFLSDVDRQDDLVNWLYSIPQVRRVNYSELTANTLSGANLLIAYVSMGIIGVLLAVSVFLIHSTIAMGISARSVEITVMKYLGATDFFARFPFIVEGIVIGLIGTLIPLAGIYSLYNYALSYVVERFAMLSNFLNFLTVEEIFRFLLPVSLLVGMGIGFLGSVSSARKHLRV